MYGTVVWATDGSRTADDALPEAVRVLDPGGRLIAFHCDERFAGGRVGGIPILADELDRRTKIHHQVDELRERGIDAMLIVETTHHNAAVETARFAEDHGAEVIVCGSRGQGVVTRAVTGGVAARLPHHAPCPVIVVSEKAAHRAVAVS